MLIIVAESDLRARLSVGAVIVRDGAILLVRRANPPFEGYWSLPGGKVNFGERIHNALVREVREETGLVVEPGKFAGLLESIDPDGGWHFVILDYFAEVTGGTLIAKDDALEATWVQMEEITKMKTTPRLIESLREFGVL